MIHNGTTLKETIQDGTLCESHAQDSGNTNAESKDLPQPVYLNVISGKFQVTEISISYAEWPI